MHGSEDWVQEAHSNSPSSAGFALKGSVSTDVLKWHLPSRSCGMETYTEIKLNQISRQSQKNKGQVAQHLSKQPIQYGHPQSGTN